MLFARLDRQDVVADFGGGAITSDVGALLLGATDRAINLVERFAACLTDGRAAGRVVHDVRTLVGQRVVGIALGHEDLNDHDDPRRDPVLGPVLGRLEARRANCAPLVNNAEPASIRQAPPQGNGPHALATALRHVPAFQACFPVAGDTGEKSGLGKTPIF